MTTSPPTATLLSIASLTLPSHEGSRQLPLRITAPAGGSDLPIIIFSHGYTQSSYAYSPLVNYWANHGFAVIQPAHLDSWTRGIAPNDPLLQQLWREREQDLVSLLDGLDQVELLAPSLRGRLDKNRIAVAGHSWGATTASMLLGATHPDPANGVVVDITDSRVKAGVLLAVAGHGGEDLSPLGKAHFPFMNPDFSHMSTPTLVVAGDKDQSPLSVRGPDWWRDAYEQSPHPKSIFTVFGGEHSLGGIHSYEFDQGDASRERVGAIQRLSTAYLRTQLEIEGDAWDAAATEESNSSNPEGRLETR